MADVNFLTAVIRLKDELSASLQKANYNFKSFTTDLNKGIAESNQAFSTLVQTMGKGIRMIASPLGLASLAVTGFGMVLKQGIKEAAAFQEAMAYVALQSQEAADGIEYLAASIEGMAPRVARDEEELARGMEAIADAGTSGTDAVKLLERVSALATTTHSEFGMTVDLVTKSMVALGISANEAGSFTEKLYKMSIAGIGGFSDMATVAEYLAGTFRTAGLSADELLASVAHLSTVFPRSREAVMAMRGAIESIRKPSQDAQLVAKALGIEFSLAALQAKGLGGFFADLMDKTKGSESALDALLGSTGAWKMAAALAGKEGERYRGILQGIRQDSDHLGQAQEAVMSTMAKQWASLKTNLSGIAHDLGEQVAPKLEFVLTLLNGMVTSFRNLNTLWDIWLKRKAPEMGREVPKNWYLGTNKAPADWYLGKGGKTAAAVKPDAYPDLANRLKAEQEAAKESAKLSADYADEYAKYMDEMREKDTKDAAEYHKKILDQWNKEVDGELKLQLDGWAKYLEEEKKGQEEVEKMNQEDADLQAEIAQADVDRTAELAEEQIEQAKRRSEELKAIWLEWAGVQRGFTEEGAAWVEKFRTNFEEIYSASIETAKAMQSAFSDFFFDAITGKLKSWQDYMKSFLDSMARVVSESLSNMLVSAVMRASANAAGSSGGSGSLLSGILGAVISGIGSYFGGSVGGGISQTAGAGGGYSGVIGHSGGFIRRMHWGGLAHDEVPAILQQGEYVVNRRSTAQNRGALDKINAGGNAGGNYTIHIHAVDAKSFYDLCQRSPNAILAPLIDNINRSGSARGAIQGAL